MPRVHITIDLSLLYSFHGGIYDIPVTHALGQAAILWA